MNNHANHNPMTEEQLNFVLSSFEAGASPEDIVKKMPNHKEEIISVLRMLGALERDADAVVPPREFLSSVLERVTDTAFSRYSERGVLSSITSSLMYVFDAVAAHARIAVPAVATVLLLVIFVANRPNDPAGAPELTMLSQPANEDGTSPEVSGDDTSMAMKSDAAPQMMAMKATSPVTGNPDDALTAFAESFSEEEMIWATGDGDIAALIADDGANAYQNFYEKDL
jgi:hypothetical protein